jgi:hypothetical protein
MDSTGYIEPEKEFDDPTGLINFFIDMPADASLKGNKRKTNIPSDTV